MHQYTTAPPPSSTPQVVGLDVALGGVRGTMAVSDRHRTATGLNSQGGDLGDHAREGLLVRHTVNYLLAAQIAERVRVKGPLLDVGSGVGVFSMWLARRLERPLHLADHDDAVLDLATRAFPDITAHTDLQQAPRAAIVTAMEVVEHVAYQDQQAFVRALFDTVLPGGVLVCSTPDERRYLGGWSGYRPHVGTLDFAGLAAVLRTATGRDANVWRIAGPGFSLSPLQRVGEPVVNRIWGAAQHHAPGLAARVTSGFGTLTGGWTNVLRRRRPHPLPPSPPDDAFSVTGEPHGPGTGLLAAVFAPIGSA